jgi:hypothetical protein
LLLRRFSTKSHTSFGVSSAPITAAYPLVRRSRVCAPRIPRRARIIHGLAPAAPAGECAVLNGPHAALARTHARSLCNRVRSIRRSDGEQSRRTLAVDLLPRVRDHHVLARLDLRGLRRIVRLRRLNLREPARLIARKTDHASCGMRQTRSPNDPRPTEREYRHSESRPKGRRHRFWVVEARFRLGRQIIKVRESPKTSQNVTHRDPPLHSHPAPRASRPARRLARTFWCDGCDKLAPNPAMHRACGAAAGSS